MGTATFPFLAALFFVSGAAALIAETVWMRWMRLVLGATAPAAAATLLAFLAGHALGAAGAGLRSRSLARPLRAYGAVELLAAAAAALVPLLLGLGQEALSAVYDGLRDRPALLLLARFATALLATLPASWCFGAALPLAAAAGLSDPRELGSKGAALYAAQLGGAAGGAAAATFLLPEWIGVRATAWLGAGLSGAVGAAVLLLDRLGPAPAARRAAPPPRPRRRADVREAGRGHPLVTGLAALSGFGTFAAQVLLVQALAQILDQSVYAFGSVVATVLLALGLASGAVAAGVARRGGLSRGELSRAFAASLATTGLLLALLPAWLHALTEGFVPRAPGGGARALVGALGLALACGGAPLLAAGTLLPLCLAARGSGPDGDRLRPVGPTVGALLVANTLGAAAGAAAAPFGLLPAAGPWGAFGWLAAAYAAALAALPLSRPSRPARLLGIAAAGALVLRMANPFALPWVVVEPGARILAVRSTPAGVVAAVERHGERLIRIDGHYALGGTGELRHERRQGHLCALLAPVAGRAVHVGAATGISAGALLQHPFSRIHAVELVPAVEDLARRFFAAANAGLYLSPRTVAVRDDARNFLALTRERFDLVIGDLFVPWRAGTGALWSVDHFENVRARLAPRGVFCQWLPLYQLSPEEVRTLAAGFRRVFPRSALFRGDFYGRYPIAALVGFAGAPTRHPEIAAAAQRLRERGETDRWVLSREAVFALYAGPLERLKLGDVPLHTDDRPRLEYTSARRAVAADGGRADALTGARLLPALAELGGAPEDPDPLFGPLGARERAAVEAGRLLQTAGALFAEGRHREAARAFAAAADRLPAYLLDPAAPDPSASELWPVETASPSGDSSLRAPRRSAARSDSL